MEVVLFHNLGLQLYGGDDIGLTLSASRSRPRVAVSNLLIRESLLLRLQFDFLHHLADDAIGEHNDRISIFER